MKKSTHWNWRKARTATKTQHSTKKVKLSKDFVLKAGTKAFTEVVVSRQQLCQNDLVLFGNK